MSVMVQSHGGIYGKVWWFSHMVKFMISVMVQSHGKINDKCDS